LSLSCVYCSFCGLVQLETGLTRKEVSKGAASAERMENAKESAREPGMRVENTS